MSRSIVKHTLNSFGTPLLYTIIYNCLSLWYDIIYWYGHSQAGWTSWDPAAIVVKWMEYVRKKLTLKYILYSIQLIKHNFKIDFMHSKVKCVYYAIIQWNWQDHMQLWYISSGKWVTSVEIWKSNILAYILDDGIYTCHISWIIIKSTCVYFCEDLISVNSQTSSHNSG